MSNVSSTLGSTLAPSEPVNILSVSGNLDLARTYTELRLSDGQVLRLPTALLLQRSAPTAGLLETGDGARSNLANVAATQIDETVIPLIEEHLTVGKRTVTTGTVRLEKSVQEYQQQLDEPLAVRTFDVERIILNHPVDTAPEVRQDGDTTIYPLVEEQLVLTKQLILKEEVRVTRRETERRDTQVVTLRREHLDIERTPADSTSTSSM